MVIIAHNQSCRSHLLTLIFMGMGNPVFISSVGDDVVWTARVEFIYYRGSILKRFYEEQ